MNELRRILSDTRRRLILLILPFLCLGLFLLEQTGGDIRQGWFYMLELGQQYQSQVEAYRDIGLDEIIRQEESDQNYMLGLYEQAIHVRDYESYLATVQKQAILMSQSSLFGGNKNGFSYRNIQKTAADFKALEGIQTQFGSDRAVNVWMEYNTADWFHLLVMILFVLAFLAEKRKGLHALIRTTPGGRKKTALSRLGILLGASTLSTLLFYGIPLGAAFIINGGLGDLGRSIQSLAAFKTCTLPVSIEEWLILFFVVKALCGFFVGVFFWFILSFLEQIQLAWLVILAVLGAEYLAKTLIAPQMVLGFLRYVNIYSYISPTELLSQYQNMNFFTLPLGSLSLMAWLLLGLLLLMTGGILMMSVSRYPFGKRDLLGGVVRRMNRFSDAIRRHLPLGAMEAYKLLFLGGTLIFLGVGVWLCLGLRLSGRYYSSSINSETQVKEQYSREIRGPITPETLDYLTRARTLLENSPHGSDFYGGLSLMEQEVQERLDKAQKGGYEAWIIDQNIINNYYGEKARSTPRWNAAIVLVLVILCSAPVFSLEAREGTTRLLLSCVQGRKQLFWNKMLYLLFVTLILWGVVFGREWTSLIRALGEEYLAAPLRNVQILENFPLNIRLSTFLLLLNLTRLAALLSAALITAWFSGQSDSWEKAAISSTGLILMPAAFYYFGQEWAGWISLLPFADGADAMEALNAGGGVFWMLPAWLGLALFLLLRCKKRWTLSR